MHTRHFCCFTERELFLLEKQNGNFKPQFLLRIAAGLDEAVLYGELIQ